MCAGSQSVNKRENKIYVMKWSNMQKTLNEDDSDESSDEDDEDDKKKQPVLRCEVIPHKGAINRIRSMYGTPIVATWNEDREVGIYNTLAAVKELDEPQPSKPKKQYGGSKISSFKHQDEGFALDWSQLNFGRLASGSCNAQIHTYVAADENFSTFVKEFD